MAAGELLRDALIISLHSTCIARVIWIIWELVGHDLAFILSVEFEAFNRK